MTVFDALISSKTRVRILMRLFLDPARRIHLRQMARDCAASPGQVHGELQQLTSAGFLRGEPEGKQTFYSANPEHPLFPELRSMVHKALGMDRIIDSIVERLGNLEQAILLDDYAVGHDSGLIDLLLIGDINQTNLESTPKSPKSPILENSYSHKNMIYLTNYP